MTTTTLTKESLELGLTYSFRSVVHFHCVSKHSCMQADGAARELGVLHQDPQAAGRESGTELDLSI